MKLKVPHKSCECCIIGAGPAGLGAALELVNNGVRDVIIVDKNRIVGGLCRTETLGNYRVDIGPHRFFTKSEEINRLWADVLKENFRPVNRTTRMFYQGKFFHYPLRFFDILTKSNPAEVFQVGLSLLQSKFSCRGEQDNFEDWIIKNFGRKLYQSFFKEYTEKVWGIECKELSSQWAAQRIRGLNIGGLLKNIFCKRSISAKTLVSKFHYPDFGAGQMYERMASKVVSAGAKVFLQSEAVSFLREGKILKSLEVSDSDGEKTIISTKHFFSSIPLKHFFERLNPKDDYASSYLAHKLKYRDYISVFLMFKKRNIFPDQWIYISSSKINAARVVNFNNFSPNMVGGNENITVLGVEYFVFKNDWIWNKTDQELVSMAIQELDKIGLIGQNNIIESCVIRETEAYPLHDVEFSSIYELLKLKMADFRNVSFIGRAGLHQYNNQDHALLSGIFAARNYLKRIKMPYSLWDINSDAEYLESFSSKK